MRKTTSKFFLSAITAAVLTLSAPAQAGLIFNITDTGNAQANAGFKAAGDYWSSVFTDDITINIQAGFANLGANILGSASSTYVSVGFDVMKIVLDADATSADDAKFLAGLPTGNSYSKLINGTNQNAGAAHLHSNITTLRMTSANAKAQGFNVVGALFDATINFSNLFAWDFDQTDGIGAGLIDFVGVAIHELGHAMGFTSGVDILDTNFGRFNDNQFDPFATVLDFTRCSTESVQAGASMDWTARTTDKNFALDGKCSGPDLVENAWSTGRNRGDGNQASHWKDNNGLGIMDPTAAPRGVLNVVTPLDIQALDVIGWDLAKTQQVPAPAGILLFCSGLVGLSLLRRRKTQQ